MYTERSCQSEKCSSHSRTRFPSYINFALLSFVAFPRCVIVAVAVAVAVLCCVVLCFSEKFMMLLRFHWAAVCFASEK